MARSAGEIQAWLVARISEELSIAARDIHVREPFASYGLDSVRVVSLSGELEEWLGARVPPTLVYEYPTIETLARHLAQGSGGAGPAEATSPALSGEGRGTRFEPVAIIGIGCRVPGADGPEAFWQLLRDGVDAISEVPADRWDLRHFYDPDPTIAGKMNTRSGGFLRGIDQFDFRFFGISPREAARMDPQQRLLLEVAWAAVEDAGQPADRLAGTRTGVFVGISTNDYSRIQLADPELIDAYAGTGNALSIAANRISYVFDFRGPSVAVDTACSSSLVAVHLACQSLWNDECALALAGGVNVILSPALTIGFTKAGAMAPDGRCKAFDARADGYVRGEGAGLVVLKPLSRALADGDPIYAVIRGSAVNQDGRTNGLMAPNPAAQEAVLREAYRRAGVSPGRVHYVEAHGTGTLLGDPIEAAALATVLAIDRPPGRHCAIGSVKTNLGHLEAAAGVAGLIKVALSLKHRAIVPSLHFHAPNPHIPFADVPLRVQQALEAWPVDAAPALAGVSSFGFGGTNVHVVLEEAPPRPAVREADDDATAASAYLLPLSARSEAALRSVVRSYREFVTADAATSSLRDLCYTASVRRAHHDHRLAFSVSSTDKLREGLDAVLRGETPPGVAAGRRPPGRQHKIVFVFPGTGSQWCGMGRGLLEQEPVFRAVIEQCDRAMRPHAGWSLLEELGADDAHSRLDTIDVIQPALFAIEVALAALWRSWGVEPDAVVGHSMGEVVAAYVAGALSMEDALRIICRRSQLLRRVRGQGRMAAVELTIGDAQRALVGYEDRLSVAASNSPTSTTLSGDPAALEEVVGTLERRGVFCRLVKSDVATHNPQMEPLRAELLQLLGGLEPRPASTPIYSTVTGHVSDGHDFVAEYWVRNLREPVLFSSAVERLLEDGHDVFLEMSGHPILLSAVQQALHHHGREGTVVPSLRRGSDERAVLLASIGALYALGHSVKWSALYSGRCVRLPAYPFQRERCWLPVGAPDAAGEAVAPGPRGHVKAPSPSGTFSWEIALDRRSRPYLGGHRIQGAAVMPASLYVQMALTAAAEAHGPRPAVVTEVEFHRALVLPESAARTVQVVLSPGPEGGASFHIYSRAESAAERAETWTLHATGKLSEGGDAEVAPGLPPALAEEIRARCRQETTADAFYLALRERGVEYDAALQSIERLWRADGEAVGRLRSLQPAESDADQLRPAILESCFHVLAAALPVDATDGDRGDFYLPTRIARVRVAATHTSPVWGYASFDTDREPGAPELTGTVRLLDEAGRAVVEMLGVKFRRVGHEVHRDVRDDEEGWLYELRWSARARSAESSIVESPVPSRRGGWLVFADSGGVGEALAAFLSGRNERCVLVRPGDAYERIDGQRFRIRPENRDDLRRLLAAATAPDGLAHRGVVHLWSLDADAPESMTVATLESAQTLGCGSVLGLVQELAQGAWPVPPSLWLVTRGAQPIGVEPVPLAVAQAPLWGLGRVIAAEHPALWGGLVDLDPRAPEPAAAALLGEEISAPDPERQLAFRDGARHVARLVRRPRSGQRRPALSWRVNGSYLITGGLGDLGLAVARWAVEQGARRLVLIGRTALPPRARWSGLPGGTRLARQVAAVRELEALGASVHVAAVDVGDEGRLASFVEEFRRESWPPIRGVVHVAGVLEDRLLQQLDGAALRAVLRPKVIGGWLLHRLLEDTSLDFFVLFSSAGSLLGQPGQGNYAAANAFLDALAHHRRADSRPALTVNWGAWEDLGFAATPGGRRLAQHAAAQGIASIPPRQGLRVLERLLKEGATQAVVLPVDWPRYRERHPAGAEPPLLSELPDGEAGATPTADGPREQGRLSGDLLRAADPQQRAQLLESYLRDHVARALGLSASQLDVHQPLNTMGLDSLMAVQVKNRVEVDLGVPVPVISFFAGASVAQLAGQVLAGLITASSRSGTSRVRVGNAEELLANIAELPDAQVEKLLSALLDDQDD